MAGADDDDEDDDDDETAAMTAACADVESGCDTAALDELIDNTAVVDACTCTRARLGDGGCGGCGESGATTGALFGTSSPVEAEYTRRR